MNSYINLRDINLPLIWSKDYQYFEFWGQINLKFYVLHHPCAPVCRIQKKLPFYTHKRLQRFLMAALLLVLIPSLPYTRNVSYCLPTNCSIDLLIDFLRATMALSLSLFLTPLDYPSRLELSESHWFLYLCFLILCCKIVHAVRWNSNRIGLIKMTLSLIKWMCINYNTCSNL